MKQGLQEGTWNQEAYLLFPVHLDGTLLDHLNRMQLTKTFFPTITVLHIFQQVIGFIFDVYEACSNVHSLCYDKYTVVVQYANLFLDLRL